ncbi:MAG: RNA 3'-terminal phosphate cyclase [Desulfurococcaceae archaeon]|uniref:RNA 3'-terminal phosphate cyclase n=1 Tax=Staphylothermus marinus TaxID=2280 RepID=A0A7C4JM15_STAMA
MSTVVIDGSFGEGGGQILRYALSFSALTLKPVRIFNIRAKRDNPGLRPQHLTAVKALAEITKARVIGDRVGSMELYFEPKTRIGGSYRFDIGTAGSVSLVIQAILPTLLFANRSSRVELTGGTDVAWSPPIDYMRFVFLHNLKLMGIEASIELYRRGHYPRGGGHLALQVNPLKKPPLPINIETRGSLISIKGISHAVRLPKHVAERQAISAKEYIKSRFGLEPEIKLEYFEDPSKDPHLGPGSGIVLYADVEAGSRIGSDSLGEKGKRAEDVGREAGEKLVVELETNMGFDKHMADMLIPYLFIAKGKSVIGVSNLTLHASTAISVAKNFFPEVEVYIDGGENKPSRITIVSPGYSFSQQ